jgi:hypothetical protein
MSMYILHIIRNEVFYSVSVYFRRKQQTSNERTPNPTPVASKKKLQHQRSSPSVVFVDANRETAYTPGPCIIHEGKEKTEEPTEEREGGVPSKLSI